MERKQKLIVGVVSGLVLLLLGYGLLSTGNKRSPVNTSTDEARSPSLSQSQVQQERDILSKPHYTLFFENTGSMNGYVSGNTRMKDIIHQLLVNIERLELSSEPVDLKFVNTLIIDRPNDASGFRDELNRANFQQLCRQNPGCSLGDTDIANIFALTLDNMQEHEVAILVSDCIISPGRGQNATDVLNQQRIELTRIFTEQLRTRPLSTLVLQLFSDYTGTYWDFQHNTTQLTGQERPWFIWVFGHDAHLDAFEKVLAQSDIVKSNMRNQHRFTLWDGSQMNYNILPSPVIGSFLMDRDQPRTVINRARPETRSDLRGVFQFSVGVDYSSLPLAETYLMDAANYHVSDPYTLQVHKSNHPGFTHILRVQTSDLRTGGVLIRLKNNLPGWVEAYNLYDDTDILSPDQVERTFGIKYLFTGAHQGYLWHPNYSENYFSINIQVNR